MLDAIAEELDYSETPNLRRRQLGEVGDSSDEASVLGGSAWLDTAAIGDYVRKLQGVGGNETNGSNATDMNVTCSNATVLVNGTCVNGTDT